MGSRPTSRAREWCSAALHAIAPVSFRRHSQIVKTSPTTLIVSAVTVLTLYVGGYFFVVHKRLQNPFISWPIMRPLPMEAYYRVNSLEIIYEPLVRLDQRLFPKRWVCPPTPMHQYEILFKNIDLNRIHGISKPPKATEPTPVGAGRSAYADSNADPAWLSVFR